MIIFKEDERLCLFNVTLICFKPFSNKPIIIYLKTYCEDYELGEFKHGLINELSTFNKNIIFVHVPRLNNKILLYFFLFVVSQRT